MDPDNLSGGLWDPSKTWNRVHGDTKSSVGGKYHIETMLDSRSIYIAKVVGSDVRYEWPAESLAPTFNDVYTQLKSEAGV
jgi:hypothetical protein